jgi:hypothetical protein
MKVNVPHPMWSGVIVGVAGPFVYLMNLMAKADFVITARKL